MFEAFKIGVRINLINGVSHGLMRMASEFQHTERAADRLRASIAAMSTSTKLLFGGGLAVGVGASILMGMKPALDAAERLQNEQLKLDALNMSPADTAAMKTKAQTDAQVVLGTTIAENTKLLAELYGATGNAKGAMSMSQEVERYTQSLHMFGVNTEKMGFAAVKALEHRGDSVFMDPIHRDEELKRIERIGIASAGKVTAQDYYMASRTGGMAYQSADEKYLYGAFAAYASANGGSNAGVGLMNFNSSLIGGHTTKAAQAALARVGMLKDGEKGLSGDDAKLAMADPNAWIQNRLVPALVAHGIKTEADQELWVSRVFNRGTGKFVSWDIANQQKIQKDSATYQTADDATNALRKRQGTYAGSKVVLEAAWENALATLGINLLPMATRAVNELSSAVMKITAFAEKYPLLTSLAVKGTALFAVLLMIGGAIAIFAAAVAVVSWPVTLAVAAIAGLIALGEWLHNLNWGAIWQGIKDGFMSFIGWIGDAWKHRPKWMGGDGSVNAVPTVGANQATQADRDYYASLNGSSGTSSFVRPRTTSNQPVQVTTTLDGKVIAKSTAMILADGVSSAHGAAGFNSGLQQSTAGQPY